MATSVKGKFGPATSVWVVARFNMARSTRQLTGCNKRHAVETFKVPTILDSGAIRILEMDQ